MRLFGGWQDRTGARQIDNNLVENAIRPTAFGKKNWLFIGEANVGERSAIIFTVIEAGRSWGMDPFEYLNDMFTRSIRQAELLAVREVESSAPKRPALKSPLSLASCP